MENYILKYPGGVLDGLNYPKNSFIACFTFKGQKEMLATCSIETIVENATYNTYIYIDIYNSYIIMFFCMSVEERDMPFLFLLIDK